MARTEQRSPRPRGQGQWALGYHEPLNAAEQIKKEAEPLDVRERIERVFAPGGFRSIGKQDLRNRMRWWGLYTQRKQGVPGERTGSAEPEELEDEFFMMRIRIDGGRLTADQLRAIAWASETYGRDIADVTDRQNVQLHWIRIEDVPTIWGRLEATGLTTAEACGDTPRVILGCPLAGIDAEEILDASGVIADVRDRFVGTREYSNLPRKYKTSISGCAVRCTDPEINDISLVGVEHPDLGAGFDLWVGGGLSTNPMFAQRLGAFVAPDRATESWAAVTSLFREYGYRRSRNQARLKFLVKDWGAEEFRRVLEKEFLEAPLPDGPAPPPAPMERRDHVGIHPQRDGRTFVGFAPRAGRLTGHQLRLVADLADRYGSGQIRTTTRQKLVILDVERDASPALAAELDRLDLPTMPGLFRRGVMACTGIEFCKLAIGETKGRARWLAEELDRRLPGFDEEIRVHVNGCPNSCARFQVADIGLMSALAKRPDGTRSDAFLVHLGGADDSFGRKVKGVKVFAEDAADYVETLVTRYRTRRGVITDGSAKEGAKEGEGPTFNEFVRGMDDEELTAFATPEASP